MTGTGGFAWWPYRDVEESDELLMALNDRMMNRPSMSGPVVAAGMAPGAGGLTVEFADAVSNHMQRPPSLGGLGYGFGSYHYARGVLRFRTFLPNALYRRGLLPNLYYSCAGRGSGQG
jgi:hypothetical protein